MKVTLTDQIAVSDKMSELDNKIFDRMRSYAKSTHTIGPLGWVRLFEQKQGSKKKDLLFEGHNIVVAKGRSFVAQRIFNRPDTAAKTNYTNYVVSHFGVGAGGSTVTGENITLLGPNVCDTALYKPITLNSTHNDPGAYDNSGLSDALKDIFTSTGAVKPISSLTFEPENYEDGTQSAVFNTKMKCECVINSGEPTALSNDGYVPISEAALFFVSGSDAQMFSHVCFAPKFKELTSIMTIEWYILC